MLAVRSTRTLPITVSTRLSLRSIQAQDDCRTVAQSKDAFSIELCKTFPDTPLLLTHTYRGNGNNNPKKKK